MLKSIEEVLNFGKVKQIISGYAQTDGGKDFCLRMRWFTNKNRILRLLDELDDAIELTNKLPDISVAGLRDNRNILKEIIPENTFLKPEHLVSVYNNIQLAQTIKKSSSSHITGLDNFKKYFTDLDNLSELAREILRVVDLEEVKIKDKASPRLTEIRKEINSVQKKITREIDKIVSGSSDMLMEDYFTIKDNRYVIPLRVEFKNKVKGIIHGYSSSKQTVFIEPENIVELDNKLVELKESEREEIVKILTRLTDKIRVEVNILKNNYRLLVYIDFTLAKARYSVKRRFSRPRFDQNKFKLVEGRHPLLIEQGPEDVVPISLHNGERFRILVITGPNTGGKTITIKTIGLVSIMFQSGMYVPAEIGTVLPIFDNIFADIGDEQSLEQSLSTFSSHLSNIKDALENCDRESLVLLDELGAGTDPTEGGAIGCGILEYLEKRESLVFTTTHLNSIKIFAHNSRSSVNASMEFDLRTLKPTYHIIMGVPGSSYALSIAERLHLPGSVLSSARNYLSESSLKLDGMLKDIQQSSVVIEEDRRVTKQERTRAEELKQEYEEKLNQLLGKEKEVYQETIEKSEKLLEEFRKDFEKIVKEIREKNASKDVIKEARKKIETHKQNIVKEKQKFKQEEKQLSKYKINDIKVGNWVKIHGFSDWAKIKEIDKDKKSFKCQIGNITITEKPASIKVLSKTAPESEKVTDVKVSRSRELNSNELDIIGLTVDEALGKVDLFINDAYLQNLKKVYIIHGLGTGRLKKGVREYLKESPLVKSFKNAKFGGGGGGTTVVTLDKE